MNTMSETESAPQQPTPELRALDRLTVTGR